MKRVLVAGALSGLLLLGAPTLASSAPKGGSGDSKSSDSKGSDGKSGGGKSADNKGGGKSADSKGGGQKSADGHKGGDNKGDHKGGGKGDHKDGDHKGDKDGDHRGGYRDGDRNRHSHGRYGHGHGRYGYGRYGNRYGYGYGGGYYGEPYDCYRDSSGYTTCEEYGGDWDPWGYNYRGPRQGSVLVREMGFNPQQVNVRPGQQVIWVFDDRDVPHTVTANNGSFDSGEKVNSEFRLAFDRPGSYSYHCALHPDMKGRVVVHG
jgi:hypothetical protein